MADWYKKMSFYQIWVRSFADGNGDGIGDLYGVYEKLDYVKSLGVDGIWFSPVYPSPNADYGYDVSDYKDIHPDFGDLEQFQKVLHRAHDMGLKIVMDLVVNHTSDEHPWFQESRRGRDNPYSDYYIWRDRPNNWDSLFEGKAWTYDEVRGQYYLHIFAKKQPDLNMANPAVRAEVESIMRFWLDMGVDGFREDVINFISKRDELPDGNFLLPAAKGMSHYKDGPHIHEYLSQFRRVAEEYDCVQIGEMPMTSVKQAKTYLSGKTKSLDMIFNFAHMQADCFMTEYIPRPFSLVKLKKAFSDWQYALNDCAWNALYLENHDHPRVIDRYGSDDFPRESGTMLAASFLFQKGTPFLYQGQEIGMRNIRLRSIDDYKDISTKNNYASYHTRAPEAERMEHIYRSSRDSARTPMQWSDAENAGFSTVRPWFRVHPDYKTVNVKAQEAEEHSILQFYRKCLALRKRSKTLLWGDYKEYAPKHKTIYCYERALRDIRYLILCNFSGTDTEWHLPKAYRGRKLYQVLGNYPDRARNSFDTSDQQDAPDTADVQELQDAQHTRPVRAQSVRLRPYEALVLRCRVKQTRKMR